MTFNSKNCYRQLNKIIKVSAQCWQNCFKFFNLCSIHSHVHKYIHTLHNFSPLHTRRMRNRRRRQQRASLLPSVSSLNFYADEADEVVHHFDGLAEKMSSTSSSPSSWQEITFFGHIKLGAQTADVKCIERVLRTSSLLVGFSRLPCST